MKESKKLILLRAVLIAAIISAIPASFIISAAIDHNPMGVYCLNPGESDCRYDYFHLAKIWLIWFLPLFVPIWLLMALPKIFVERKREKPKDDQQLQRIP